jgi:hypothetical protein
MENHGAVELGYTEITYLTFTKSAAQDGEERLRRALQQQQQAPIPASSAVQIYACTLHACAHRLLTLSSKTNDTLTSSPQKLWSDKDIRRWISSECKNDVQVFLQPCYDEIASRVHHGNERDSESEKTQRRRSMEIRALEQVEFFIYKSLVHFCQSCWTLEVYKAGTPFNRDYYPIRKFHGHNGNGKQLGFPTAMYNHPCQMAFYANQAARLWEIIVRDEIRSFDLDMKRVQILQCRIPGQILLVDESQDMDACQIHWIAHVQTQPILHPSISYVYVVGDPAQSIYGFRGARPRYWMELSSQNNEALHADLFLTETWRFGPSIANIANLILFAKEHSVQTTYTRDGQYRDWIPYRIRTVENPSQDNPATTTIKNNSCKVTQLPLLDIHMRNNQINDNIACPSRKFTFIARENVTVLLFTLQALGFTVSQEEEDNEAHNNNFPDEENALDVDIGSVEKFSYVQGGLPEDHNDDDGEEEYLARLLDYEDYLDEPECFLSCSSDPYPKEFPKVHVNGRERLWNQALAKKSETC